MNNKTVLPGQRKKGTFLLEIELPENNGWRSVAEDGLPIRKGNEPWLVSTGNGDAWITQDRPESEWDSAITHWMYLPDPPQQEEKWRCPHCGSDQGTWFDRSIDYDSEGNPHGPYDRCEDCGKDVDEEPEQEPSVSIRVIEEVFEGYIKAAKPVIAPLGDDKAWQRYNFLQEVKYTLLDNA